MNYSVDYMKRAAFVDELNNHLKIKDRTEYKEDALQFYQRQEIIDYFEKRIKEIDDRYKSKK